MFFIRKKFHVFYLLIISILTVFCYFFYTQNINYTKSIRNFEKIIKSNYDKKAVDESFIRDFYRYECKSIIRYPPVQDEANTDDNKQRKDGSYFLCEDGRLKLKKSNCIVLSFGINKNDKFDEAVNNELNCVTHSFDPFIEPSRVIKIRRKSDTLKNAVSISINHRWKFHSLGITNYNGISNINRQGWLDTYGNILKYLKLNEKIIDVFKMDAEGAEWESIPDIMSTNSDLLCKYVKQIAIETHPRKNSHILNYEIIKSLEVCFRLYRRDQRFYKTNNTKSEWQIDNYKLPLSNFRDEIDLARWLFMYGELYFVNRNFL